MQRHVFDGVNRVSQKQAEAQPLRRWLPPTIDKGGKLIHAEPREESQFRQAVSQSASASHAGADDSPARQPADFGASYDEGYEQGLLAGRKEGLQKGLAEGREQGQKLGYDAGFEEGRQAGLQMGEEAGLANAQQTVRQQLNVLNSVMTHLTHAVNDQDYQLELALLGLVREVARQVVARELSIDSRHIMKIVQQALNTLPPTRDNVRILVNTADKELVMRAAEEGGENWRVIGTPQIERGGCRVETDHSAVDFTTGARFRQAIEQIVSKQFAEEGDLRHQGLPPGESFEEAPEPVVKAIKEAAGHSPRRGLAEEAESLAGQQPGSDPQEPV
ncbi:flagellar assembly protein FliH [Pseudohongiella spirulinae]|uniref:Flagellar assembly protein FliH n=1 Tax=Pseudohongiella spirulinae TaxID=1249552 RepID=A0A0S2KED5_9GAMM|nr:flagellar assembly protein FliH [Pseudohongiella spirulinae]ALO46338.1 Flagellar assembly protein FliH [Pseudohongiella spirulinae]